MHVGFAPQVPAQPVQGMRGARRERGERKERVEIERSRWMWQQGDEREITLRKANMYSHVMHVWKCVRKEGGGKGFGP